MSDLISRQAAIDATWFEPSYTDPLNVLTEVRDRLEELPSVQPKRGQWEVKGQDIYCSQCGNESAYNPFGASKFSLYCPNCGARMEASDD